MAAKSVSSLTRSLAAAVLVMALGACGTADEAAAPTEAPRGERLVLRPIETTSWQDVSGEITTVDQAQVIARIPGILTSLTVREGDMVGKGQVIGRIVDNQLGFQAEAYRAQAALAQAELERVRFLHRNGVYADAKLEQAQAAATAARAQQGAAAAVVGQGALVAPAAGRVLSADVPAGSPVAPGMAIAVITSGATVLRLEIPESLAEKVRAGSRVRAVTAGEGEQTGSVIRLYPAVTAGQITADVALAGLDSRLIGKRVPAKVEAGSRKALVVPARFVTSRFGIDYVTLIAKDGSASQVPVQTAPGPDKDTVELLSGAAEADTLVAASQVAQAR